VTFTGPGVKSKYLCFLEDSFNLSMYYIVNFD